MRHLLTGLAALLLALIAGALLVVALALESQPRVAARDAVSPADVERAVALARAHDPRAAAPGQAQSVVLAERDLDLLLDHAARRWLAARTRVRLLPARAVVQASVAAPFGRWWNFEMTLREGAGLPQVERLRIGRLPLPAGLALPLVRAVAARHGVSVDALLALDWIERVSLAPAAVRVSYRLGPDAANRLRAALVSPQDEQRLRAQADRLLSLTQSLPGSEVSLASLLTPLFALAAERSRAPGGDAVAENRAALLVLTLHANRQPLGRVLPAARAWPQPRWLTPTLQARPDFALHFLVSAVIAAQARTPLADAVGLWKELADARAGGSGFSFNDLAADRAGTRFGELAVGDPGRLQARVGAGATEADVMPEARDLAESMPEAEFVARYGGVGAERYNRVKAEIEARVAALPLYR
ncbi:MAG: hypothetical protein ABIX46_12835 [Burkholderiaceae bacterium]